MTTNPPDSRRIPLSRADLRLQNEAAVFRAIKSFGRSVTVAEINAEIPSITERTVRRGIEALCKNGFVVEAGRSGGRTLYQPADASPLWATGEEKRIPLGGKTVTVKDFIEVMASPEINPFTAHLKKEIFSDEISNFLRVRMLFAILSSGEAGFDAQLEQVKASLFKTLAEMKRLVQIVEGFTDSPVWYAQYRDGIAYDVRRVTETNAELIQLAWDFVKSSNRTKED